MEPADAKWGLWPVALVGAAVVAAVLLWIRLAG
jgi:hypothetical protein